MIRIHSKQPQFVPRVLLVFLVLIFTFATLIHFQSAEAAIVLKVEESSKYKIHKWHDSTELQKRVGFVVSQIIVQIETEDRIEGYVADARGTRLEFSNELQSVQARYVFANGGISEWKFFGLVKDGYFTIPKYTQTELAGIRISIGPAEYTIDNGNLTHAQSLVFVNPSWTEYAVIGSTAEAHEQIQARAQEGIRTGYDAYTYELGHCNYLSDVGDSYTQCIRLHKATISDEALESMGMLTEKVASLGITSNSLDRAVSLLTDTWVHNDAKGCAKLISFTNRMQVLSGEKLTHPEADDIQDLVDKVMHEFGC